MFEFSLENGFDFLSQEYRRLFAEARASAFQHPIWLSSFYGMLTPALGVQPAVLVARWRDGRLAMVLPLVRRRVRSLRVVEFADLGVTDYAAPVCCEEAFAPLAGEAGQQQRVRNLLKPFDILRIKNIPDWAPRFDQLFGSARRERMGMSSHAVPLFQPFDQWRGEKVSSSLAKQLAKRRRQIGRLGDYSFQRVREPAEIESLLQQLQAFRGERFPGDLLTQPSYFEFYRRVALEGAATGLARAYRLSLDGRSLGGVWGLSYAGRFMVLITGLDYANYGRHSIGGLAFEDVARDCIAEGDAVLDFTLGDEAYKQLFGTCPSSMWMIASAGSGLGLIAQTLVSNALRPRAPRRLPSDAAVEA